MIEPRLLDDLSELRLRNAIVELRRAIVEAQRAKRPQRIDLTLHVSTMVVGATLNVPKTLTDKT